ncbi:Hypothetical protein FKW44_006559, partial [Caligus rogercresseyi]
METKRRNFKALRFPELEAALNMWPWEDIYTIKDPDEAFEFLEKGITAAMDIAIPIKIIKVHRSRYLYLAKDTLDLMNARDRASGDEYRHLHNRVSSLCKLDHLKSNLKKIQTAENKPKTLWGLANNILGKSQASLPASLNVNGTATV